MDCREKGLWMKDNRQLASYDDGGTLYTIVHNNKGDRQ